MTRVKEHPGLLKWATLTFVAIVATLTIVIPLHFTIEDAHISTRIAIAAAVDVSTYSRISFRNETLYRDPSGGNLYDASGNERYRLVTLANTNTVCIRQALLGT